MWNIKTIFALIYLADLVLTMIGFKLHYKNILKHYSLVAKILLFNFMCLYFFFLNSKIYLLFGFSLAATFALIFSIMDVEVENKYEVTFANKIMVMLMSILFWPQVITTNYIVIYSGEEE